MHVLQRAGLAAAAVQSIDEIWRDARAQRAVVRERIDQPDVGPVTYPRSAQLWTKTPGVIRHAPSRLGQHTNEVLREWTAASDEDIDQLASDGAIFDAG